MAATSFAPSLSTSGMHAPYQSADAPSMADSLPSVNFGFEDLRERMNQFSMRFDQFIEKGRKRVLEERNQFRMNVAELQEDQRMRKRDIEITALKTQSHAQTLSKESAETAEMHTAISTLTQQRDDRLAQRDTLKAQIADLQRAVASRRQAQQSHQKYLNQQSRFNQPELDFWQDYLCLRIEGAGQDDKLKFVFSHITDGDWEREAWFELDTHTRDYRVGRTVPKLEKEAVENAVEKLNEGRALAPFLKAMRNLFAEAMTK